MKRVVAVAVFCVLWLTIIFLGAFNKDLIRINNSVIVFIIAVLLFVLSFMNIPSLNNLFVNAGLYLKMISKGLFVISLVGLIITLIGAFAINIKIGIFCIMLLISEFGILIFSLILYGYGDIVENSKNLKNLNKK